MGRAAKEKPQLTPLELKIMQALWQDAPATVQGVQERLSDELAYTTVQTMLNVLVRKGHVKRRLDGRAYAYTPVEKQEATLGSAVGDLVERMFGGSIEGLLMNLVETRQVDPAKLEELARRVARAEAKRDASAR